MPSVRRISGYSSIAVLLLAFVLRTYHLSYQASLSDDALGLVLARRNPLDLFSITATEPFPPTFYVTLSLWTRLAGDSEYAGRFYSVLFSMLAVALMYVAGRRLLGGKGGIISAFLLAINPFDIYFAQEVRMYTMLVLFSLASSIFAFDLLAQRRKPWVAYTLTTLLAVMTHAFALFVLFAQDVVALVGGPRGWRWLRSWAICQLAVIGAFVLWISLVAAKLQAYNNALVSSLPLPAMFWRTVTAYGLGFQEASGAGVALPVLLAALAGLGLIWLAFRQLKAMRQASCLPEPTGSLPYQGGRTFVFLLCYLGVPFFTVWIISLFRPIYYERYMAVTLPPLLLLAAGGVVAAELGADRRGLFPASARRGERTGEGAPRHKIDSGRGIRRSAGWALGAVAAVAVLGTAIAAGSQLRHYYQTVVYARSDDMRALSAQLLSVRNPLVIVNVAANDPLYGYYLPPAVRIVSTLDVSSPQAELPRLVAGHPTIWFLPFGSSDHQRRVLDWLSANEYPMGSRWFGNAQVLGFGAAAIAPEVKLAVPTPLVFGRQIQLVSATAATPILAGEPVEVTLTWQAFAKPDKNYSIFVHLLDGSGKTISQHDGWPAAGTRPSSAWQPGETISDRHGLVTPTALAPGSYKLEVGLYDATGQRLKLANGASSALVGEVAVRGS